MAKDKNEQDEYTFFYGGPFSQWFPCILVIDGHTYNCAEQYMMAQKARLFGDSKSESLIMEADHPMIQKRLGRQVVGFDKRIWESVARDVVMRGNLAKFTQHKSLMGNLFDTEDTLLVEASPTDTVWGIGLGENDPRRYDRKNWRGTNWLGQILTDLRMSLRLTRSVSC